MMPFAALHEVPIVAYFDVRDGATLCQKLRDERTSRGHRNSVEIDPKATLAGD